jgi:hypothetical protein
MGWNLLLMKRGERRFYRDLAQYYDVVFRDKDYKREA